MTQEWNIGSAFKKEEIPVYVCCDSHRVITEKQYKRESVRGSHHLEPWDCDAQKIDVDEVERKIATERKRRRARKRK